MEETIEKGTISIHTENIFPIIKKSLYADTEIFIRELASNGVDACQKLKKVADAGQTTLAEDDVLNVNVTVNKEAKTLTFSDNGIGMTADEVRRYINQIAFSGATEFLEKFQANTQRGEIIGAFGLGFYSAFMVSDKVEIFTKSWQEGEQAMHWSCTGSTEFELQPTEKDSRGTEIILHVSEDSEEYLDAHRVEEVLRKYCRFLPIEVRFDGKALNEKAIWTQHPSSLTEEDYKSFYRTLYPMGEEPLFWIHLNVDYPFNLTGILYFPKVDRKVEIEKEKIQLYSRQVFITDEVKGIVPDFLMLMHGVIDSPDIPLNVSRSYLQTDANVRRISGYVTRKVSDRLSDLFKEDRAGYEAKWEALGFFVKYGTVSDPKFEEKAGEFALLKNLEGQYYTLEEYGEKTKTVQTDKEGNNIWLYATDKDKQATYIKPLQDRGYDVLVFDDVIDSHYLSHLEQKLEKTRLKRVDTGSAEALIEKEDAAKVSILSDDEKVRLADLFKANSGREKLEVRVENMLSTDPPVQLSQNEFMLRMEEMARLSGRSPFGGGFDLGGYTLLVNGNHPSIGKLLENADEEANKEKLRFLTDLAYLPLQKLTGQDLAGFMERAVRLAL